MKKGFIAVAVVALGLMMTSDLFAFERLYNPDFGDNGGSFTDVYCPSGTRLIGAAYFDLDESADAISVVCENKRGEHIIPKNSDWPEGGTNVVVEQTCDWRKGEALYAISYKDRDVTGKHKDAVDGVRVGCKMKNGSIRWSQNDDLNGGRNFTDIVNTSGKKILGISYKDGGCGGQGSDCVDAVTLITK